jgi:hypothetical protein
MTSMGDYNIVPLYLVDEKGMNRKPSIHAAPIFVKKTIDRFWRALLEI